MMIVGIIVSICISVEILIEQEKSINRFYEKMK